MDIVYQYGMPGNDDKYHLYSALCSLYSICCIPTMKMEAKEVSVFTGQYFSVVLKRQVTFSVVLPVDVFTPQGKIEYIDGPFPTMYLLHGFSGNHMDWLYNGHIMELAAMRRIAFVMSNGENSFYLDNPRSDQAYSEFIGKELVDVTRRPFPLSHKREETYIGGLSMGGFGALRNGLYYNDVFGSAAALSSALITDEVAQMKPGKGNFMAPYEYYAHTFGEPSGTEDFLYPINLDMHEALTALGIPHEWLTHPGIHDFKFWNYALPLALDWIQHGPKQ